MEADGFISIVHNLAPWLLFQPTRLAAIIFLLSRMWTDTEHNGHLSCCPVCASGCVRACMCVHVCKCTHRHACPKCSLKLYGSRCRAPAPLLPFPDFSKSCQVIRRASTSSSASTAANQLGLRSKKKKNRQIKIAAAASNSSCRYHVLLFCSAATWES